MLGAAQKVLHSSGNFDQTSNKKLKETLRARVVTSTTIAGKGTEKMNVESIEAEALERHNEIAKRTVRFYLRALTVRKAPHSSVLYIRVKRKAVGVAL